MTKINVKSNIPNFITLSNLFLGFVSIVLLALSLASDDINLKIACYLIFIAAFRWRASYPGLLKNAAHHSHKIILFLF